MMRDDVVLLVIRRINKQEVIIVVKRKCNHCKFFNVGFLC
jgi:hypothetical protein